MKPETSILNIAKTAPVLMSNDLVRRASGLINASEGSAVFVRSESSIRGILTEQAISAFLASDTDIQKLLGSEIGPLVQGDVPILHPTSTVIMAAEVFGNTTFDVLPIVDEQGMFYGAVYRKDAVNFLAENLRPASVGGMATPLGVFLTTGFHRAGAGALGLFLTGVSLRFMITLAAIIALAVMEGFRLVTGLPIDAMLASTPLTQSFSPYDLPFYISAVLSVVFFLIILRLSPLSGYHAAEHMTVNAIERGEDLTPDVVRQMPRVHPRCGSNILAIAGVFLIVSSTFGAEVAVLVGVLAVVMGWRKIGEWMQHSITTSPPSEKQLLSGIAAGKEILAKYRENPAYQVYGFQRLHNTGFLHTLLGMAIAQTIISYIQWFFGIHLLL